MLDEERLVHEYLSIKHHNPYKSRNQTKSTPNIDDTNKSTKFTQEAKAGKSTSVNEAHYSIKKITSVLGLFHRQRPNGSA